MTLPPLPYQTLHSHTVVSDGKINYKQALDICVKNKIGVIAFTDHDALPGEKELKELNELKSHEVEYVIGIELSSGYPKEIGGSGSLFHIVGLFVDPHNGPLVDYTKTLEASRRDRTQITVKKLQELGFSISFDDVLVQAEGVKSLGRPHIVRALMAKPSNSEVLTKIEQKLKEEMKTNAKLEEITSRYGSGPDDWQRYFALVLSDDSYINNVYTPYEDMIDFDSAVSLIKGAGGVSILAHWTFSKGRFDANYLESFCEQGRIEGLETVYGFNELRKIKEEIVEDMKFLETLVKRYNLIAGGGGDFHREEDFASMLNDRRLAEKTIGLLENIIDKKKVDLTWSSVRR